MRGIIPNATHHNTEQGNNKAPALIFSAANGNVDILKSLLSSGANIEGHDATGLTALMSAAFMGNDKIVEALRDQGARAEARDEEGLYSLNVCG